MIFVKEDGYDLTGSSVELAGQLGLAMVVVYRKLRTLEGERMALGMMTRAVQMAIENEKIKPSELLAVIKDIEEADYVSNG